MTDKSRKCPACGFENHGSSRFCIKCGQELAATRVAQTEQQDEPEPPERPEMPQDETEKMLQRIVEESNFEHKKAKAGWKVSIPMGEDREQKVYVMFNGQDDQGNDIISFLSLCGEADEKHAVQLLRLNSRQPHGAFAIKTIQGKDYFVMTANQLATTADPEEVQNLLMRVAARADDIERELSGGGDVF